MMAAAHADSQLGAYERIDVTAGLRDEVITNLSSAESSLGLALD